MAGGQEPDNKASRKRNGSKEAIFFGREFEALRRKHEILRRGVEFARLVHLSPTYISKIQRGTLTTYHNFIDYHLPVFIAFGAIFTAREVRKLTEPVYGLMSRQDLDSIGTRIRNFEDPSLTRDEIRTRANFFISSIDDSYEEHPSQYTLDEVVRPVPPAIRKIKPASHGAKSNLDIMNHYHQLSQSQDPNDERLLINEALNQKDNILRYVANENVIALGGNDSVRALPKLMGDDPSYGYFYFIDRLPKDTAHRAKDAWKSLLNHPIKYWRILAAWVFSSDPDQCEELRILKMVFEDTDKEVRREAEKPLHFNIKALKSLPAIEYLLSKIEAINSKLFNYRSDEWKFNLLQNSLEELVRGGNPLPEPLRNSIIRAFITHLRNEPIPSIAAIDTLALPDFKVNTPLIARLLEWKFPLLMDDDHNQYIVRHSIETLIKLGAPKVKQYLLEIYKHTSSREMKSWACKTLITKTDMKFSIIQKLRYNLNPIYHLAGIQYP